MIDTLVIVCHLAVNISTMIPAQPQKTCAFERHRARIEAASNETAARTTEHYRKEIAQLTQTDELFGEIRRILNEPRSPIIFVKPRK